jgi:ABC-type molybdate transport system substrate-binding protein
VVILKKAENNKTAQAFIDYVRSAEGKKIIEASGYSVP